jgi:hypothetical protein
MKTVCVQIGNSDGKLTQQQWSEFVRKTEAAIQPHAFTIHFSGFSRPDAPWQNACWVADVQDDGVGPLTAALKETREGFGQDSVVVQVGETRFV